jgi:hypothetical protein
VKKIKKIFEAVKRATRPYDVPADHAFSRKSVEQQTAIGAAALARARYEAHVQSESAPIKDSVTT